MPDEEQRTALQAIMSNARISERYLALARDLDVMAPRTPEEVGTGFGKQLLAVCRLSSSWMHSALPACSVIYRSSPQHGIYHAMHAV